MNREQRRKMGKGMDNQRLEVTNIVISFKNGQYVNLDTNKVMIIDRTTNRPLFEEVLEPLPQQIEAGEEVEVIQKDDVTSVKRASPATEFPESEQNYSVEFDTPEGKMEYVKNGNWSGVRKVK